MINIEKICRSEIETMELAYNLSSYLVPNTLIYLSGNVGSGKTFFSQSIAKYFGFCELKSSSFSRITQHPGKLNIIHCDFFKKSPDEDFINYELEPTLIIPWLLMIEWPYKLDQINSEMSFHVNIQIKNDDVRFITINQL